MEYRVEVSLSASKALAAMQREDRRRIEARLETLKVDPRPHGAIKMAGMDAWRIRVGTYRVVYVIDDMVLVVTVIKVAHRREVYRRLR